jgi:hypothetical protein
MLNVEVLKPGAPIDEMSLVVVLLTFGKDVCRKLAPFRSMKASTEHYQVVQRVRPIMLCGKSKFSVILVLRILRQLHVVGNATNQELMTGTTRAYANT